jgi:hypothetical protein
VSSQGLPTARPKLSPKPPRAAGRGERKPKALHAARDGCFNNRLIWGYAGRGMGYGIFNHIYIIRIMITIIITIIYCNIISYIYIDMYTLHIYIYKYDLADNREHLDSWPLKYYQRSTIKFGVRSFRPKW